MMKLIATSALGLLLVGAAFAEPTIPGRENPLVNWHALQNAGLTGKGITVEIDGSGIRNLRRAYSEGLLDPSQVTIKHPNSVGRDDRAVRSAEIVHMVAPQADIYICNGANTRSCENTAPQGQVVVLNAVDLGSELFYNGSGNSIEPVVSRINTYANTLFYVSDTDSQGKAYTEGHWVAVRGELPDGSPAMLWNIGAASGNADATYLTLSNMKGASGTQPGASLTLLTQARNVMDDPKFEIAVYDNSGSLVARSSPSHNRSDHSEVRVTVPRTATSQLPLHVYVEKVGGTITGSVYLKLFGGSAAGVGAMPYAWSPVTAGSIEPFRAKATPNDIMVTGVCTGVNEGVFGCHDKRGVLNDGMGIGPLTVFDTGTREFTTLQYPTVTGDFGLSLYAPGSATVADGFAGTSDAAPELAAVAALLLQAGLTPGQIATITRTTAVTPGTAAIPTGQWNPDYGHGIEQPLATLKTFVDLPTATIEGTASLSLGVGEKHSFKGSCTPSAGATVTGYKWYFGDGTTATGKTVTHAWSKPDRRDPATGKLVPYVVQLNCYQKARDGRTWGDGDLPRVAVTVGNNASSAPFVPPGASFHMFPPITVKVGESLPILMICSPGSEMLGSWSLDYGDGNSTGGEFTPTMDVMAFHTNYSWSSAGSYTVTLTCTDIEGHDSAPASFPVTVKKGLSSKPPTPPTASFRISSLTVKVGESAAIPMICVPGSVNLAGWNLEYGDGTSASGGFGESGGNPVEFGKMHSWGSAGSYTAKLTCTDVMGNDSDPATLSVTVKEALSSKPPSKGGGGGAMGWLALIGLLGLAAFRRRR